MLTAETFALKRKLKTILWCANYFQDKGYNKSTLGYSFSFFRVNHSPNHRAQGEHIVEYEPSRCCSCKPSDTPYTLHFVKISKS